MQEDLKDIEIIQDKPKENLDTEAPNSFILNIRKVVNEFIEKESRAKSFNSLVVFMRSAYSYGNPVSDTYTVCLYNSNEDTTLTIEKEYEGFRPEFLKVEDFLIQNIVEAEGQAAPGYVWFEIKQTYRHKPNDYTVKKIPEYAETSSGRITREELGRLSLPRFRYSTLCFTDEPYRSKFIGGEKELPTLKALVKELKGIYKLNNTCNAVPPTTPQPPDADGQGDWQNDTQSCSNTGQFGGGGTPLKDIKLFLYANKVTKGTIKLSKPQVEVGTYATDWRPNPADATKSIEMMLKQIESVRKGGRKNGKKRD